MRKRQDKSAYGGAYCTGSVSCADHLLLLNMSGNEPLHFECPGRNRTCDTRFRNSTIERSYAPGTVEKSGRIIRKRLRLQRMANLQRQ
jgi:hypothetical protein